MNKNMERLNQFKEKFESWDDNRIKKLFDRLVKGEVLTFQTTSLDSCNQNAKEMQRVNIQLKQSNHFGDSTVKEITQYVLYFWENVQNTLLIEKDEDEFKQFKKWFFDLLDNDSDEDGLAWDYYDHFITEWKEFTDDYSFSEMWDILEEEDLV